MINKYIFNSIEIYFLYIYKIIMQLKIETKNIIIILIIVYYILFYKRIDFDFIEKYVYKF